MLRLDTSLALVLLAAAAACSGGDGDDASASGRVCDPGATQTCLGPGACDGGQVCDDDGQRWLACVCGAGVAAGSGGDLPPGAGATGAGASSAGEEGGSGNGTAASGGSANGDGGMSPGGAGAIPEKCGDGALDPGEACDDANNQSGDGCSEACAAEPTHVCTSFPPCPGGGCSTELNAVFRDFDYQSTDDFPGSGTEVVTGLVATRLGEDLKPRASGLGAGAFAGFPHWYRDTDRNATLPGSIKLFSEGDRWSMRLSDEGEKAVFPGELGCATNCVPCLFPATLSCERVEMEGNPLFFPVDSLPAGIGGAGRAVAEGRDELTFIDEADMGPYLPEGWDVDKQHNFYFTSEVAFALRYDPERPSTIEIAGDDDIWVFVNGHLIIDLGGVHTRARGDFTVDAASVVQLGITPGDVYDVRLFHAERRMEGSSLNIAVEAPVPGPSACVPAAPRQ